MSNPNPPYKITDIEKEELKIELSSGIQFVPHVYGKSDLVVHGDIGDFTKWIRLNHQGIPVQIPANVNKIDLRSGDIWIPLAIIANDVGLPIYLNIVASYLYDRLKGALPTENPNVSLKAQFEAKGKKRLFEFDGDARSFKSLVEKFDIDKFYK